MRDKQIIKKALEDYIKAQNATNTAEGMWEVKKAEMALAEITTFVEAPDLLNNHGGAWLGIVREWIKCKFRNGESVTWGSNEVLEGNRITVSDLEKLASRVAASAINEAYTVIP